MIDKHEARQWRGRNMVDADGEKIGKIDEIYEDIDTGAPEWALVNTGLFGTRSTFVPLEGASAQDDTIRVPHEKSRVKDAPNIDADEQLSREQEAELYRYYGVDHTGGRSDAGVADAGVTDAGPRRDTRTRTTDDAMTRSEEELDVSKTQRETGRARLRKYVVTEDVTKTVPVQREEVRLEREPVTDANVDEATGGPAISEDEHEVTLHEEEVRVDKHAVPKERVRMDTDTVTEEQQVSEELRKEEVELEGDEAARRR